MAIDFPNSPSVNDVYSADERSWKWDGTTWRLLNGWQTATIDDLSNVTAPSPSSGDFLKWNGSAWVNDPVNLGTDTTGDYVGSLVAGTGVTLSNNSGEGATPTVAIGQSVGTSDSPTFAGATLDAVQVGITAAGEIDTASGNLTIDSAGGTVTVDDDLVVTGDLTVSGTTTTVNTETINLADNIITLNSNETGTPSQNAGLEVERGTSANVELRWNETSDKWELTEDGSTYYDIATESYVNAQSITSLDEIGDVTITSAASGEFLKWNGSAWVNDSIPTINTLDDVGDVAVPSPSSGEFLQWDGSQWVSATVPTINVLDDIGDVSAAAPSFGDLLKYDGSGWTNTAVEVGDLADVSISSPLTLQLLRFDGSNWVNTWVNLEDLGDTAIVSPSSGDFLKYDVGGWTNVSGISLGTDTTGNYMVNVSAGDGINVSHTQGEGSTATISARDTLVRFYMEVI